LGIHKKGSHQHYLKASLAPCFLPRGSAKSYVVCFLSFHAHDDSAVSLSSIVNAYFVCVLDQYHYIIPIKKNGTSPRPLSNEGASKISAHILLYVSHILR